MYMSLNTTYSLIKRESEEFDEISRRFDGHPDRVWLLSTHARSIEDLITLYKAHGGQRDVDQYRKEVIA